ncbi:MAG: hypothetical protein DCO96_09945 [Fluviicola sp. XM-24bin1]|nr:MAG: hypothetical protein DCO96_09945 [Fluviicola sp. XM-24bin1]
MKKIVSLICLLFIAANIYANDDKIVESKISKVTVYSQGAQVYRTASYAVNKGVTQVIIEGISPRIDPKSLQVKATGNSIILDTKYNVHYPQPEVTPLTGLPLKIRQQITRLEDSILNINYDIQTYQDEIDVLNATKNILKNNGAMRGQGKVNDSIPLLKTAIEYYTEKMMSLNKELQSLNRKRDRLTRERKGMNERLQDLRNYQESNDLDGKPKGPIPRVVITMKTDTYVKGNLKISYLVGNAGWTPIYDLRSEISNNNVNLNYKAQVYQNTGVDWTEVPLTISTNNPYQNKTKPELHPWYVDYRAYQVRSQDNEAADTRSGQPGMYKKAESLGFTSGNTVTLNNAVNAEAAYSYQFTQTIDYVISAEFVIDLPYTIKSNNEQHMVLVKNIDIDANYRYYTVPKHDKSAYLVAELTKMDELQLVPATANIYFDGTYMGETYLDPTSMEDTMHLSLGKDPNIIVKRTLLERDTKEKVVGTKMVKTYAYSIEVKNLKSKSIELVVQDQIPVTTNTEIEITATELSKGTLNKRTGMIEWKVNLKPKTSKDLEFIYEVKYDKDKNVVNAY